MCVCVAVLSSNFFCLFELKDLREENDKFEGEQSEWKCVITHTLIISSYYYYSQPWSIWWHTQRHWKLEKWRKCRTHTLLLLTRSLCHWVKVLLLLLTSASTVVAANLSLSNRLIIELTFSSFFSFFTCVCVSFSGAAVFIAFISIETARSVTAFWALLTQNVLVTLIWDWNEEEEK